MLIHGVMQILNAEEELKRRSSIQGIVVRPSVSLQVDVTNDSGSMNRQVTPRLGSEANLSGDMEGVEGDELSNHNFHTRHMHRMNSTSPSSESPLRRPAYVQHSAVICFGHRCFYGTSELYMHDPFLYFLSFVLLTCSRSCHCLVKAFKFSLLNCKLKFGTRKHIDLI